MTIRESKLAARLRELALCYQELAPMEGQSNPDYELARTSMLAKVGEAIKHQMHAEIHAKRNERTAAAQHWWAYRRATRSAYTLFQCARVAAAYGSGDSSINDGEAS